MGKNNVSYSLKKKYVLHAIKWCKVFFGENERKKTKLKIEFTDKKRNPKNKILYGNYCFYRNKITIYENSCETIHDIVSTVIHEYTHYLQSRTKYLEYQSIHYYSTNPYEREAKRNEEKYTKICIREIKKLIH